MDKSEVAEERILVVDDSPTQAEELAYFLGRRGYTVDKARNGREAMDRIGSYHPSIVISDIVMPEMDGYELCRRIKGEGGPRGLPVILLTTLRETRDVMRALECGADFFINKRFDGDFLLSHLDYIAANRALWDRNKVEERGELDILFGGERFRIASDRRQILNLLLSTYDTAVTQNARLEAAKEELQAASEGLEAAREIAESNTRAKYDFLANMSHELRTPLNSIIGFTEVLQEGLFGDTNEKQREYLAFIDKSSRHLLDLINDILDIAKIESGKVELDIARFRVAEVVAGCVTMFKERAMRHSIALKTVTKDLDGREMESDERKVKQILFNLLSNAVKFTPDGGSVTLRASLEKEAEGREETGLVRIEVEDTGIGIKAEESKRLFTRFAQMESAYKKKYEGTGLGLSLVKDLTGLLGGSVTFTSEFGRGSVFTVLLPLLGDKEERP